MANVTVNFKANTAGVQSGINKLKSALGGLAKAAGLIMAPLAALGGAAAFGAGIKDILSYGGKMSDLANRTGLLASEIVVLEEAFRQAGLEGADVATTLQKLSKNILVGMQTETSQVSIWMEKFGLSLSDVASLNMAQQFELISSKIGALTSDSDKAAAASAMFGAKQGLLLVNLFKTSNAMEEARTTVGGLAGSMDKWAAGFDYIDDMLGSIPIKVKQFFAAFVGNNLEDLTKLADAIKNLDLTNIGQGAGEIVNTLTNALKEGNLFEVIGSGLSVIFKKIAEEFASVLEYAGQKLTSSIRDGFKDVKILGKKLIPEREVDNTFRFNTQGDDNVNLKTHYKGGYTEETYQQIRERNKNRFGSVDAANKFESYKPSFNMIEDAKSQIPAFLERTKPLFNMLSGIPEKLENVLNLAPETFKPEMLLRKDTDKKGSDMQPFKPVLSSLQKVGGAAVNFTKDPLVSLQKTANGFMKETASNTTKMLSKMGEGAAWA